MSATSSNATQAISLVPASVSNHADLTQSFFSSLKVLTHATATPLTNLLINLELLERDLYQTKTHTNAYYYLSKAVLSAKYLKEIMKQCKGDSNCINKEFLVKDAIREMLQICKNPQHNSQLISYLQLSMQDKLKGNKLYFQEMLICLINNAFQAYQPHDANQLVVITANKEKMAIKIRVVDGGSGFLELNDSLRQHHTHCSNSNGTGLRFVRQVISTHFGGSIKISSTCHRGSCVECHFPLRK